MEKENIKIVIQDEKSKEEIIYNNIIASLPKDKQVNYLKNKVLDLEEELHSRMSYTLLFLFSFVPLFFGIIMLILDLYILGSLLVIATFLFIIIKFMIQIRFYKKNMQKSEFIKVEKLKKILEDKLK